MEMLDKLIEVFEVMTPEIKLIVILQDLQAYNELKELAELLRLGVSIPNTDA